MARSSKLQERNKRPFSPPHSPIVHPIPSPPPNNNSASLECPASFCGVPTPVFIQVAPHIEEGHCYPSPQLSSEITAASPPCSVIEDSPFELQSSRLKHSPVNTPLESCSTTSPPTHCASPPVTTCIDRLIDTITCSGSQNVESNSSANSFPSSIVQDSPFVLLRDNTSLSSSPITPPSCGQPDIVYDKRDIFYIRKFTDANNSEYESHDIITEQHSDNEIMHIAFPMNATKFTVNTKPMSASLLAGHTNKLPYSKSTPNFPAAHNSKYPTNNTNSSHTHTAKNIGGTTNNNNYFADSPSSSFGSVVDHMVANNL
jgi:hypothetical protein